MITSLTVKEFSINENGELSRVVFNERNSNGENIILDKTPQEEEPPVPPSPPVPDNVIWFSNNKNWSEVWCLMLEKEEDKMSAGFGVKMTFDHKNAWNEDVYSCEVADGATVVMFNNFINNGVQQTEFAELRAGLGYYIKNNSPPYILDTYEIADE